VVHRERDEPGRPEWITGIGFDGVSVLVSSLVLPILTLVGT